MGRRLTMAAQSRKIENVCEYFISVPFIRFEARRNSLLRRRRFKPDRFRRFVVKFIMMLLPLAAAFAQDPNASVVGRVTDPTGAVVPGVKIQLQNLDTN